MPDCSLLTPRELAQETGWPEKRIRNLIASKSIRHLRNGANYLLPKDAIHEYICQSAFKIDPVFAHKTDPSKAVL